MPNLPSSSEKEQIEHEIREAINTLIVGCEALDMELATLKTGEQDIIENAGASFVFSRVNDEWKVIYYHESSSPPTRRSKEH